MKILRTAVLPVLLCVMILGLGFSAPGLFDRLVSDQKERVETVPIAGKESPLYVESNVDTHLPPWDVITGDGDALPDYDGQLGMEATDLNQYIFLLVEQIGLLPSHYENFYAQMYVYDNRLVYLQDYTLDCGDLYTLDVVLTLDTFAPLYLHARSEAYDTEPVISSETLLSNFSNAVALWLDFSLETDILQEEFPHEVYVQANEMDDNGQTRIFLDFFNAPLHQIQQGIDSIFYSQLVEEAFTWQNTLSAMLDAYTLTYEDETVLVLTNEANRACTIYFDGARNRVTGFGFDAATFGYASADFEASP